MKDGNPNNKDLQKLKCDGMIGGEIDILFGIMYNAFFPHVHSLPNGLTIYKMGIESHINYIEQFSEIDIEEYNKHDLKLILDEDEEKIETEVDGDEVFEEEFGEITEDNHRPENKNKTISCSHCGCFLDEEENENESKKVEAKEILAKQKRFPQLTTRHSEDEDGYIFGRCLEKHKNRDSPSNIAVP